MSVEGIWIRMDRAKVASRERHVEIVMLRARLIIADPVKQLCKVIGRFTAIGAWNRARSILFPLSSTTANRRSRYRFATRYEHANGVYRDFSFFFFFFAYWMAAFYWIIIIKMGHIECRNFLFNLKTAILWNEIISTGWIYSLKKKEKGEERKRNLLKKVDVNLKKVIKLIFAII